jgi:hypothetical protein
MGNLLGDYGEHIALSNYNLKKAPRGADGYDAVTADGLRVQIKANHSSSTIGFRGEADLLLVLKIESNAEWRELYYGPFRPVKEKATYSKRDNKFMIPVAKLQALAKRKS